MRLGIAAPAGAGKTMGALLVAYGLVGDWSKIGLADTEMGSGELYVDHKVPGTSFVIGEFNYVGIDAPYTVAKYVEAQRALEEAGCTDAQLLAHVRSPGPHVRGCFAVDAVLGKS